MPRQPEATIHGSRGGFSGLSRRGLPIELNNNVGTEMKKPVLVNSIEEIEIDTPREPTLGEQLDALERLARDVLSRIARDPVRGQSTHPDHADLYAIEVRLADLLVPLAARRRM
jgi:hypothetical protein